MREFKESLADDPYFVQSRNMLCLFVYLSLSETFFWIDKLVSSTARSKIVITWFILLRFTRKKAWDKVFFNARD